MAVHEHESPCLDLVEDREQVRLRRGEARACRAHYADISRDPAQHPLQPLKILLPVERDQQRMRARIDAWIVNGLHGEREEYLVPGGAGDADPLVELGRIGIESQRDSARQIIDRRPRSRAGETKAREEDRDARAFVGAVERPRIGLPRLAAVGPNHGKRSQCGALDQGRIRRWRQGLAFAWTLRLGSERRRDTQSSLLLRLGGRRGRSDRRRRAWCDRRRS